ncbi:MAG: NAD(P)/FAD-dependent oxidoreductase [Candidatus Aenigmarchaeota archaeon]|nr:NAD(P)/FAD-dependent oxidoreductase [Candidatus Aenigmarchaeota archaeon]
MSGNVIIVGGGINGLVAANYLQKNGFHVTVLERNDVVGGACAVDYFKYKGKRIPYATGASVLGLMQDFVFKETGLDKYLTAYLPKHPEIIYFESEKDSDASSENSLTAIFRMLGKLNKKMLLLDEIFQLKKEFRERWGERGKVNLFFWDLEKVRSFLIKGYRNAEVPTIENAEKYLGKKLAKLWISGSARGLLDYYFTSEKTKLVFSVPITMDGPVSLDSPYSAFTLPLMFSGTIFDGKWGIVKGGIWNLTKTLGMINKKCGVNIITASKVIDVSKETREVTYVKSREKFKIKGDYIIFATDPLTAAKLLHDKELVNKISRKEFLGTSGKMILIFKKPVIWKNRTNEEDFDSAFRLIFSVNSLDEYEKTTKAVAENKKDFQPAYFELYCEGAGMRKLGIKTDYDIVSAICKNVAFSKKGKDLNSAKKEIERVILSKIENKKDLIKSIFITPKDLRDMFHIPKGNMDHIGVSNGQTFFERNYSPNPEKNFYQFGDNENIFYCGSGSYPCGSVAGTPAYMCTKQIIKSGSRQQALLI